MVGYPAADGKALAALEKEIGKRHLLQFTGSVDCGAHVDSKSIDSVYSCELKHLKYNPVRALTLSGKQQKPSFLATNFEDLLDHRYCTNPPR